MGILSDRYAFTLAHTYGLMPHAEAKYEPGSVAGSDIRFYVLAAYIDKSNVLVKFDADDMPKSD